jgi:hypothetical protein
VDIAVKTHLCPAQYRQLLEFWHAGWSELEKIAGAACKNEFGCNSEAEDFFLFRGLPFGQE